MQNFLVLGEVPGTNIQLSFEAWLLIVLSIITFILFAVEVPRLVTRWHAFLANSRARKARQLLMQHHLF